MTKRSRHRLLHLPAPAVLLASLAGADAAWAHGSAADAGGAWPGWEWDPFVAVPLAAAALAYAAGLARLWSAAGPGGGVRRWQAACFAAGWLVLALALVSPLDRLGEAYFSMHMVQHQAMMLVAAPLIILGAPLAAIIWALPPAWRRAAGAVTRRRRWHSLWRGLSRPAVALSLYALALWAWHAPRFYEAALASYWLHALQHMTFLTAALMFWRAAFDRSGGLAGRAAAILGVAVTAAHSALLGALMTFAARPWYGEAAAPQAALDLTPLEDQQLAGLIMWVPGGLVHLLAGAVLAALLLGDAERRAGRNAAAAVSERTAGAAR